MTRRTLSLPTLVLVAVATLAAAVSSQARTEGAGSGAGAGIGTVAAAAADSTAASTEQPFSRERWLRQHRARLRLDETPGRRRASAPLGALALAPLPAKAGVRNLRVSRDILGDASPGQQETQTEPFLAADPANESVLLAAYQEGRFEGGGCRTLTFAWSRDAGKTWTEGRLPGLTRDQGGAYERVSDPWVGFGPDGRAYYTALTFDETTPANGIYVSVSEDGGQSWGEPVRVHANTNTDFDDKQSLVVDNRTDSLYHGRVYVGWDTGTDDRQILRVSYSADGGLSYSEPVAVHDEANRGNLGIVMAVGPGGVVHAVWTQWTPGGSGEAPRSVLVTARSHDGGDRWSAPQPIADLLAAGVAGMRTGDILPSLALDPRNGALYVVWQDARFTGGAVDQVLLSRSTDGGTTWSAPVRVSDGPGNAPAFTAAVAVNGKGQVGVSYYSLRNDPGRNNWVDLYLAVSRDGGRSFGASRRVSARAFPANAAARSRGSFLGDYQGLVAGKTLFRPLFVATLLPSRDGGRRQSDAFVAAVRP